MNTAGSTNRRLASTDDLAALAFAVPEGIPDAPGLLPVVAQDAVSGAVLMVAYADHAALLRTLDTGEMHFWSRSRRALWKKGETSGNVLSLVSLHADCDADTVLALVHPTGPACHTGEETCFGVEAFPAPPSASLQRLDQTLAARDAERPEGSYTTRLLTDTNLRLKKLGEESAELVAALATSDRERAVEEAADLMYHTFVALRAEGVAISDVIEALEEREG